MRNSKIEWLPGIEGTEVNLSSDDLAPGGFKDFMKSWEKRYGGNFSDVLSRGEVKADPPGKFLPSTQVILENAPIDSNFIKATVNDFDANDFDGEPVFPNEKGLFIYGNVGVGKTHYSWGLYKRILVEEVLGNDYATSLSALRKQIYAVIHFTRAADVMLEIYDTFDKIGSQRQIIDKYSNYPTLIIDDLSSQRDTEFYYETFLKILDSRISNKRITIINSNLNLDAIYNKNQRLGSRLHTLETLYIGGVDRRKVSD